MRFNNQKMAVALNSIVWACLILLAAYLFKDHQWTNTIFIFVLGTWYMTHAFISRKSGEAKKACCGCSIFKSKTN